MPADVAILIIAYNSEDLLGPCLRSVIDQRLSVQQQIIVLDNASPDSSAAVVERDFPEVTLLRSPKNLGFAGGMNLAARHADAEFILLLNPDTVILDHAIDRIVEFARKNPGHGLYGGRTLKRDGSLEPSSCWGLPSLYSLFNFALGLNSLFPRSALFNPESLGSWPRHTVREVGMVTGCFLLIPTVLWKQLKGFDERYFMYGEDADLALRVRQLGHRPILCPDARLIHEVGKSSKLPAQKALLLYRGKATLIRTHWKGLRASLGLFLLLQGVFLRTAAATVAGKLKTSPWASLWAQRQVWTPGYP